MTKKFETNLAKTHKKNLQKSPNQNEKKTFYHKKQMYKQNQFFFKIQQNNHNDTLPINHQIKKNQYSRTIFPPIPPSFYLQKFNFQFRLLLKRAQLLNTLRKIQIIKLQQKLKQPINISKKQHQLNDESPPYRIYYKYQ